MDILPKDRWFVMDLLSPCMCVCVYVCSVVPSSLRAHGLQPATLVSPWDSPGKDTGVGCHVILQGIFPTQRSNPHLLRLLN